MWQDYGADWNVEPEYATVLDQVVQQSILDESSHLDALIYTTAMLWFAYGGVREIQRRRWRAEALPVLERAHLDAADRGAVFARTIHGLNTRSRIDSDVGALALAENPAFTDLVDRMRRYIDSPVNHARWRLSLNQQDTLEPPTSAPLRRAVDDATSTGLLPAPTRDTSRYRDAMQQAAATVTEQAVGDSQRAHAIGMEEGAVAVGTIVERWLKVPHGGACGWCFTVAARGYRSAQSVARHSPVDKCGARPLLVAANNRRKGETVVGNEDWYQSLIDAGYGGLIGAEQLSPQERLNVVRNIIRRSSDFQPAIDSGTI
jgi:hypothetical protein